MRDITVAAVSVQSRVDDPKGNLERMTTWVEKAIESGAGLVLFPEANLTGYGVRPKSLESAQNLKGPAVTRCRDLAESLAISLSVGLMEYSDQNLNYLTQLLISPRGKIEAVYRKLHLGPTEVERFGPGEDSVVISNKSVNIGIQICFDAHFPELSTMQALDGAELILAPHASPKQEEPETKLQRWLRYLPARAYDNTLFLAACNPVGDNGEGWVFPGVAMIIGPKGELMASYTGTKPGMALAKLKGSELERIRSSRMGFFRGSRRPELYRKLGET